MAEAILVNDTTFESRVAIKTAGVVSDIFVERCHQTSLVGNIYLGTVVRVLPSMQAAFVDIGKARTAFLHLNDIKNRTPISVTPTHTNNIGHYLRQGQSIVVQVIKDAIGDKGARLTTHFTLPSRYLVYKPYDGSHINISQKISDHHEKKRLKAVLKNLAKRFDLSGTLIVRTAAQCVASEVLERDVAYVLQCWQAVLTAKKTNARQSSACLHQELPLPLRCLRDFADDSTQKILVDNQPSFVEMVNFAKQFMPDITDKIAYYGDNRSLFGDYGVEQALQTALQRQVDLKLGGYLIIDQTEAMTVIDVNTGSFVGKRLPEQSIYQINLEAAQAIAHQLRLRNVGGMIVIDFIDMAKKSHQNHVLECLKQHCLHDYAAINIGEQFSTLGLVEMTRTRTRLSLGQQLCEPCPTCQGKGDIKSSETLCFEIFRQIIHCIKRNSKQKITVIAHATVIERLTTNTQMVADLKGLIDGDLDFVAKALSHQEQYHVMVG